jgi:uncharacterized protein YndB with AHSA1/START domain
MSKGTLQVSTPSDVEIVMTRIFAAPRELVFKALTTPELVRRWLLGPPGWSMPVCEIDLRVGGGYRYGWRNDQDGSAFGLSGAYREILRPERIVNTEVFQGMESNAAVGTLVLTEAQGRTTLTTTMRYPSKQVRDAVIQSGMEAGAAASYDRLEQILAGQA